jgi:hypothetical protein
VDNFHQEPESLLYTLLARLFVVTCGTVTCSTIGTSLPYIAYFLGQARLSVLLLVILM